MKYHKFCNCLSHRVFPAPRGKEMENQSFREFISRKDTPTRATGRETGGIEPSRRRFAGTQARIQGGASDGSLSEATSDSLDTPWTGFKENGT